MIFPFATLISYISSHITLEPGDVILSGTPDGVIFGLSEDERVWLHPGDEIIVEAECLGRLRTVIGE
jgi:2-keto-4-pentenoate hydratase/2-oxohepta-3-ene-1,7-dioic acid hydratase in catechol pathway